MDTAETLIKRALEIDSTIVKPEDPFTWASGKRMPIYNDNRMHLWYPENRKLIRSLFCELIERARLKDSDYDFIAGTSTAGISPATTLADFKNKPLIYIRDKPKDHGLKNRIEGRGVNQDLKGFRGLLIEDLVSTAGSSVSSVQGIRDANGECNYCFAIFSYGFDDSQRMFRGEIPYDKEGHKLERSCYFDSAITYKRLLEVAKEIGKIKPEYIPVLDSLPIEQLNWGINHGFPPVERK